MLPEEITKEYLDELSEELTDAQMQYLQYKFSNEHLISVRERLEKQVPKVEEIIGQYTQNQYVQQKIEIQPGLTATFRTLIPKMMDESLRFAQDGGKSMDQYQRLLARRRLAHGLVEVNGNNFNIMIPEGSYFNLMLENEDLFEDELLKQANKRYKFLSMYGLAEKLQETFGVWEQIIYNRINGKDDLLGVLKNSTRGPAKEQ